MAPLLPSFARCLVLVPLALGCFGCDLLKRGGDADAGTTAPVAPPPATPATTAAPVATPPPTAPLPTLTAGTPAGKPVAVVKTADGGTVAVGADGGPVAQPTFAIPSTLPSGIPTAIPSSIAKTLPSGFPTTLPTAFPQIPPLPGQDAGKR